MSDETPATVDQPTDEPTDQAADDTVAEADAVAPETVAEVAPDAAPDPAPELVEPAPPLPAETDHRESMDADVLPVETEHVADPAVTGEVAPVFAPVTADAAVPAQQAVYVQPAVPPRKRGNRLIGILLALAGGVIFAGVYAVVVVVINRVQGGVTFGKPANEFANVFSSAYLSVAVAAFVVSMIVLVLLLNRAGWWAHVLGSLILAIAVYFATIGGLLFIGNVLGYSPEKLSFLGLAVSPWVIAAAVVAREVSIWTGLAIAARGRRVKARNTTARAVFDREQEAQRAQHAGAVSV